MRPDFSYIQKPDQKWSLLRNLRVEDLFGGGLVYHFGGDFNDDGLKDLLVGNDSNTFTIYLSNPAGLFSSKSSFKIQVPVSQQILCRDLNQDGYSDILIWYPQNSRQSGQVLLLQSEIGSPK
jgi:hypothetical protein